MRKRTLMYGLLSLFSVGFLTGCGNNDVASVNNVVDDAKNTDANAINVIKNDRLAINVYKCVGCGKCARIAPANFEINKETHKAQVKSNEISNQSSIDRAVASCHPQAINQ